MASGLRILVPVKRVIDYAVSSIFPLHAACGRPGIGILHESMSNGHSALQSWPNS
jgi:hypothetical protein